MKKNLTLPLILSLLALTYHAAPSSSQPSTRQVTILSLTFYGAGENPPSYNVEVPLAQEENFQNFNTTNPLIVSRISLGGPGFCGISGIDGSETSVQGGGEEVDVAPPQVQVSGVCSTF